MILNMVNTKIDNEMTNLIYEISNISKSYAKEVLKGCSLNIYRGNYIAILGKSGSGKSTLLNIISLLETYDEGEIKIFGAKLKLEQHSVFIRKHIGFIFQNYNLIESLTVIENIMIMDNFDEINYDENYKNKLIERLGLKSLLDQKCSTLSGGEKQRTAIARALLHKPTIIIADEPTGNLDEENTSLIFSILDEQHEEGTTVLLVTHDEGRALKAERTLQLLNGKLRIYEKS